jgi:hypothetical protein
MAPGKLIAAGGVRHTNCMGLVSASLEVVGRRALVGAAVAWIARSACIVGSGAEAIPGAPLHARSNVIMITPTMWCRNLWMVM